MLATISLSSPGCIAPSPSPSPSPVTPSQPQPSRFLEYPTTIKAGTPFAVRIKADRFKEPIRILNEKSRCLGQIFWVESCQCKEIRVTLFDIGTRSLFLEINGKIIESQKIEVTP